MLTVLYSYCVSMAWIIRVWSIYQLKLKSLKELQLKKKLEEKSKLEELKKKSKAAIIIQKYWRGYR